MAAAPFRPDTDQPTYVLTYADLIHHCLRYIQRRGIVVDPDIALEQGDVRRCIQSAVREVCGRRTSTYFQRQGRIQLNASYSTGTIAYDHTGGTYERQVTLTTGTWPSWAASGTLRISDVNHVVTRRISDTVVTLDSQNSPAADIASGTTYTLYQSTYALPADFVKMYDPQQEGGWDGHVWVSPDEWQAYERNFSSGTPYFWTIAQDPTTMGRLAVLVNPAPSTAETWDFTYLARMRQLVHGGYGENDCKGTATTTATSATVSGTNTAFASNMAGCIIRFGSDNKTIPTGLDGHAPRVDERTIISVASATSLTVDQGVSDSLTGVRFSISDPVDIEQGMVAMLLRCCEKHLAIHYDLKNFDLIGKHYEAAYILAAEEDSRNLQRRVATGGLSFTPANYSVETE